MHSEEKTVSLASGVEQAAQSMQINEVRTLPHTVHSNTLKWPRGFNVRHNILKIPEKSIGKTYSDTNHNNIFLGQSPKEKERKGKTSKWDLMKLCTVKEAKQKEKNNLWTGRKYPQPV